MQYFPLFFDLNNKSVLVVGGGEVASRKVDMLIRAGADVTIVSPELNTQLNTLVQKMTCRWIKSEYKADILSNDFVQVWATTNDNALNHQVHKDAKNKHIMVNVVDDKPYCDFITPSVINRGKVQVAISSGGASPVLVRRLRETIESVLPMNLGLLAEFSESKRESIKQHFPTVQQRRLFWEAIFNDESLYLMDSLSELDDLYHKKLFDNKNVTRSLNWVEFGEDVELISMKTLRTIQKTECVLFPEDCPFEFVDLCRRDAERMSYHNEDDLNDMLNKLADSDQNHICIFMPKGSQLMGQERGLTDWQQNTFAIVG